jgi:cysteinyl-tRNA synthetase
VTIPCFREFPPKLCDINFSEKNINLHPFLIPITFFHDDRTTMMKTACYFWALFFASGVSIPATTAWTGSKIALSASWRLGVRQTQPPARRNRVTTPLRMSNSESGHNFSRAVDPNTNNLDVDVAAVNALIVQRVRDRAAKDFAGADSIIGLLLSRHGVIINDTDKTWKTGTKREIKKRPKNPYPGQGRQAHKLAFKQCPDSGPNQSTFSDEEVINMVAVRRQAQLDRDFKTADQIRYNLKNAGVYVEDGLKEWRADGIPFNSLGSHRGFTAASSSARVSLVRSTYSLPLDGEDETLAVNNLLAQRTKFKSGGDYEKSDSIRDRLFETYDIRIDDRLGEWSVGGDFGDEFNSHWATSNEAKSSRRYVKSATSADLTPADEEYVQGKIDERMRAKRTRNFDLSDSIRDDLFSVYDVTIHDKINEWSVGGDFGEDESWTHREPVNYKSQVSTEVIPQEAVAPQEQISISLSKEQLSCLTVVQLKEKLRDSGARVTGNKEELINRLLSSSN